MGAGQARISPSASRRPSSRVGTKVIVAAALGRLEGVGQDLVAMCVNDLVTCGARAFQAGEIPGKIELLVVDKSEAGALQIAERFGIPSLYLKFKRREREVFEAALLEALRQHAIDYVFLAGFMRILGQAVIDAYWGRILNIHPALLPAFPGLHVQAQALAAGVKESGCTVHFVDCGVDTGPIILQRRVPVLPGDDEETLAARILEQEHLAYPEAARLVLSGRVRLEGDRVVREEPQ